MYGRLQWHPCLSESLWLDNIQNCTVSKEPAPDLFLACLHKLEDGAACHPFLRLNKVKHLEIISWAC